MTRTIDRTGWPRGPWDDEDDLIGPLDLEGGMVGIGQRGGHGAWCGYVILPAGHVLDSAEYWDVDCDQVYPHGGLTFADRCTATGSLGLVRPDAIGRWAFGFDCAHYNDMLPCRERFSQGTVYMTKAMCELEIRRLAEELLAYRTERDTLHVTFEKDEDAE